MTTPIAAHTVPLLKAVVRCATGMPATCLAAGIPTLSTPTRKDTHPPMTDAEKRFVRSLFRDDDDPEQTEPTARNWRPGRVLDCFGGSGTTAVAAALEHRDAVLIDIDRRNVDLVRRRLHGTVRVTGERHHVRYRGRRRIAERFTWTVETVTATQLANDHAGQLDIFGYAE